MKKSPPILYFLLLLTAVIILLMLWKSRGDRTGGDVLNDDAVDLHSERAQEAVKVVQASIDAAEVLELSNGLQVVVIPDPRASYITNMVWYRAGAADDPPGKSGLAHFVEHLTFAETDDKRENEFSRLLKKLGKRQDALTTYDFTVYFQFVTRRELESVFALEAHRMAGRRMESVPLSAERQEVLEERREWEANPENLLDQRMRHALYGEHPYGRPVLGWPKEFDSIDANDASEFYRQRYVPNNAIVLLQGPFDAASVRTLVDRYFGAIPRAPIAQRRIPTLISKPRGDVLGGPSKEYLTWRLDLLAPSYAAGPMTNAHALQVLIEMLGGCAESRLQSRLVRQSRDATSVEVIYDPESLDLQVVSIIARVRPDRKMRDLAAVVHAELSAIAAGDFHEAELKHVKRDLTAKMTIGVDGMPPAARLVGEALVHGRTLNEVREWRRRIEEVGINEVREAAKALSSAPSVTGLLTDKSIGAVDRIQIAK